MTATATGNFTLTRAFGIAPADLWPLLTDPETRAGWSAPSDSDVLILESQDLREGGTDRHRCGAAEAPDYKVETYWYRLDAPSLACFSETVDAGGMRIATSLVTYGLEATDGGCSLQVIVHVSSFVGDEALADFETGWISALDRLRRLQRGKFN